MSPFEAAQAFFTEPVAPVAPVVPPVAQPTALPIPTTPAPESVPVNPVVPQAEAVPPVVPETLPVPAEPGEVTPEELAKEPELAQEPSRAQEVLGVYKEIAALAEPDKLGFVPTSDEIVAFYADSQDHNAMMADVMDPSPKGLARFVEGIESLAPGAGLQFIDNFPKMLKEISDPSAPNSPYGTLKSSFLMETAKEYLEHAKGNPKYSQQLTDVAKALYYTATGKMYDPASGLEPPEDPEKVQLREQVKKSTEESQTREIRAWNGSVIEEMHKGLGEIADTYLADIKNAETPEGYKAKRIALVQSFIRGMEQDAYTRQLLGNKRALIAARLKTNDPQRHIYADQTKQTMINFVLGKARSKMKDTAKAFVSGTKPMPRVQPVPVVTTQAQPQVEPTVKVVQMPQQPQKFVNERDKLLAALSGL